MSFHKSKGLSSPFVYMVGCVDGLIPSRADPQKTPNENAAKLEEDRRLFYVAMTRVKADLEHGKPGYLHLSYPRRMPTADAMQDNIGATEFHGQTAFLHASRLLGELSPQAQQPQAG